jgi:hypothetical protein
MDMQMAQGINHMELHLLEARHLETHLKRVRMEAHHREARHLEPQLKRVRMELRMVNHLHLLQRIRVACVECLLNQVSEMEMTVVLHPIRVQWARGTKVDGSQPGTLVQVDQVECGRLKDVPEVMRMEVACLRLLHQVCLLRT